MTTPPLVSVLMPSLNQCQFIEAAVRSTFQADFPNVEVIVADGGSCDGTVNVLERLTPEFSPRLRWISARDRGPADAVNRAFSLARGHIIGWLNADDLYAPGAIAAAAGRFSADRSLIMVYGEAKHIGADDKILGRYPTLEPTAGIHAFQRTCYICQPTVFLRRDALEQLGGLDVSLSAAFDFDLWLRVFAEFPGRLGFINRVQAFSRLHGQTITSQQRRKVASEAVRVLAKHLGHAQPHWVFTYIDEAVRSYPTYESTLDLHAHVMHVINELSTCFSHESWKEIRARVEQDKRLTAVSAGVHADFFADGWVGSIMDIRLRSAVQGNFFLVLMCENRAPVQNQLQLSVKTSDSTVMSRVVDPGHKFKIIVPFKSISLGQSLFVSVQSTPTFVPKEVEPNSTDSRALAYKIKRIYLSEAHHSMVTSRFLAR